MPGALKFIPPAEITIIIIYNNVLIYSNTTCMQLAVSGF